MQPSLKIGRAFANVVQRSSDWPRRGSNSITGVLLRKGRCRLLHGEKPCDDGRRCIEAASQYQKGQPESLQGAWFCQHLGVDLSPPAADSVVPLSVSLLTMISFHPHRHSGW